MHYIIQEKNKAPILVYDAPVDEKTKKVREMFDVDEKTGYPKHYNWRGMARLGPDYRPEDPFLKFDKWDEKNGYSGTISLLGILGAGYAGIFYYINTQRRPWWSKPQYFIAAFGVSAPALLWIRDKTFERQGRKDAIYVDYMRKHPERFETIHRPKLREILFEYVPIR